MLNETIKAIRKSKGLSQEELAIKLNVVRQTISKWEQGLSVPDSDMLISISEALETSVSTLLGETVKMCIRDRHRTEGAAHGKTNRFYHVNQPFSWEINPNQTSSIIL